MVYSDRSGLQGNVTLVNEGPFIVAGGQNLCSTGIAFQCCEAFPSAGNQSDLLTDVAAGELGGAPVHSGSQMIACHTLLIDGHGVGAVRIVDGVGHFHQIAVLAEIFNHDGAVRTGLQNGGQCVCCRGNAVGVAFVLGLGRGGEGIACLQGLACCGILLQCCAAGHPHGANLAGDDGGQLSVILMQNIDGSIVARIIGGVPVIVQVDNCAVGDRNALIAFLAVEAVAFAPGCQSGQIGLAFVQVFYGDIFFLMVYIYSLLGGGTDDLAGSGVNPLYGDLCKGAPVVIDRDGHGFRCANQGVVQVDGHISGNGVDFQLCGIAGIGNVGFVQVGVVLGCQEAFSDVGIEGFCLADNIVGVRHGDRLAVNHSGNGFGVVMIHGDGCGLPVIHHFFKVECANIVGGVVSDSKAQGVVALEQGSIVAQIGVQPEISISVQRIGADTENGGSAKIGSALGSFRYGGCGNQHIFAILHNIGVGGIHVLHFRTGNGPLVVQTAVVQVNFVLAVGSHGNLLAGLHFHKGVGVAAVIDIGVGGVAGIDIDGLGFRLVGFFGICAGNCLAVGVNDIRLVVVVHGDIGGDAVIIQPHDVFAVCADFHGGSARTGECIILSGVLGLVAGRRIDGGVELHSAHIRTVIQGVACVIALGGIALQVVFYLPGLLGNLSADSRNVEGNLYLLAVNEHGQVGVLVGRIVFGVALAIGLLEALGGSVQGDGVAQGVGIGGGVAFSDHCGVFRVQLPGQGAAVALDAGHIAQKNVIAHGVGHGGAVAVHACHGGAGHVGKGGADAGGIAGIIGIGVGSGGGGGDLVLQIAAHSHGGVGSGGGGVYIGAVAVAVQHAFVEGVGAFAETDHTNPVMLIFGFSAMGTQLYVLILALFAVGAHMDIGNAEGGIGFAVADGIQGAQGLYLGCHGFCLVQLCRGGLAAASVVGAIFDAGGAGGGLAGAVGGLAVRQQNRVLIAAAGDGVHAQPVPGQHQAGIQIGAALGAQPVNGVFQSLQIVRALIGILNVYPVVNHTGVGSEVNDGNEHLSGVGADQSIQEAVLGGQSLFDCLQTAGGFVFAVFCVTFAAATAGAPCHGVGQVDDELYSRIVGGDGLRGDHLQGHVKGVLTGLGQGLLQSEAVTGGCRGGGGSGDVVLGIYLIIAVHHLVFKLRREGLQGHDAQKHNQNH